jgi:hypothetical protein
VSTNSGFQLPADIPAEFLAQVRQLVEPTLLSLGLFLVELAINKPWTVIRINFLPEAPFKTTGLSEYDFVAVNKILEDARNERPLVQEGPRFIEVVRKCVTGDFNTSEKKRTFVDPCSHHLTFLIPSRKSLATK